MPSIRQLEEILEREGQGAVTLAPDGTVILSSEQKAWAKGMEDAALIADEWASKNYAKSAELFRRVAIDEDMREQTVISAQVLGECERECRALAEEIRLRIARINGSPQAAASEVTGREGSEG